MSWLIIVAVFILYVIIKSNFITKLLKFKEIVEFSRTVPGPPPLSLFFNVHKDRVLPWQLENRVKYGPVFRIWFGPDLNVLFSDPEDIKVLLSSNTLLHKSRNYDLFRSWLGDGLLTSGGSKWRASRKALTPGFHFKILGGFQGAMNDCCDIMINKLKLVADGRAVDIYSYLTLFALDVICETAMGIRKDAQKDSTSEYVLSVKKICQILHHQSFSTWKRIPFLFSFSSDAKRMHEALQVLHGETRRVISERKIILEKELKNTKVEEDVNDVGSKKRKAFLDMLLIAQKEGANLSDEDIREEVDTFMFEGHDTTSSALAFTLYLLAKHKEIQQRVYEEVKDLSDSEDPEVKYLEAVIKESLRIYPSVPFYSRKLYEDLEIAGRVIPAGVNVTILAYMAHRDPKHYPNPEKFDPERFLGENAVNNHPFAHVAFSAGPRNCIGRKFAMLELRCTLSKIVRTFELLPVKGFEPELVPEIILKSGNGIKISLRQRT